MDLKTYFQDEPNLGTGIRGFFSEQLQLSLKTPTEKAMPASALLKEVSEEKLLDIEAIYFGGKLSDQTFQEGGESASLEETEKDLEKGKYDSILVFGVELSSAAPSRSRLAEITRWLNRKSLGAPVTVIFRYGSQLAFANGERTQYKHAGREGEKVGRVAVLRDIDIANPHTGHLKILAQLVVPRTGDKKISTFEKLYQLWQEVFSVSLLNKKFYQELSNWYFWAIKHVVFPSKPTAADAHEKGKELDELIQEHKATNVIRMLTRLLFVWFIKEKKLIPEDLFDLKTLQKDILNDISPFHETGLYVEANKDSIYYKAILQNLFFATLNCPIEGDSLDTRKRGFRGDESRGKHFGIDWMMRYKKYFKDPDAFLEMVNQTVPFLNGGLFECLDDKPAKKIIDGFSDNENNQRQLIVPDYLFFGTEEEEDLSKIVGITDKKYKKAAVKGLINILKSYKFTITENTPIEEDVALDPELLGKVFENLLASYNPETKTTARKQTGSFYTPREIVNYMVDESLIAYLKNAVTDWKEMDEDTIDRELHALTSFDEIVPFAELPELQREIIHALSSCTILDPACGSGAFPMGILQKMVHILQKLDPGNKIWKEVQLEKARKESEEAFEIDDKQARGERLQEINEAFDQSINDPDYARKLFLIENCIYGVDIQPIATQISKLRFFISLVVEQKPSKNPANNFNIRPLPNLETKFVAANTLIGIEKPTAQTNLFDSQELRDLENQLKKVRSKLFSARTKETKLKYRELDKSLREDIADKLKSHGWQKASAEKLAGWDPYDQNSSSSFFDPEWMFDINDGFDVVIGNPPYASAVTMARSKEVKQQFKRLFPLATGAYDIFILFLFKAIQLTNENGQYSWIIPNKFLIADYAFKTYEYLLDNGLSHSIDVSSFNVFENASVYPIVILGDRSKKEDFQEWLLEDYTHLEKRLFKKPTKLKSHSLFSDFNLKFASGATGFEAEKIRDLLTLDNHKTSIPFTVSGGIDRFQISNSKIRFMGMKLETAYVNNDDNSLAKSKWKLWKNSKIIIAGMTKEIEAVYVPESFGIGVGVYCIYDWKEFNPYYITALLNSHYLTYYLRIKFKDKHLARGYLAINKSTLEKLPLKASNYEKEIGLLSKILHYSQLSDKTRLVDSVIDSCIYQVFYEIHMKEKEIDILEFVEQDINEVMQGREFEDLSDNDKNDVINQLNAKWTDPDNEVLKRMGMFKERSPEILKVILES
jgi:adenine-specific DNA-methyltransferase